MRSASAEARGVAAGAESATGVGAVGSSSQLLDQTSPDRRVERRLPGRDRADRTAELDSTRVFREVAAGTGAEGSDDRLVVGEGREHEHGDLGVGAHDERGGLGTRESGHAEVHQHDVGAHRVGEADRRRPVGGLPHDLEALDERQQRDEAVADDCLVVGDEDPDGGAHRPTPAGSSATTRNESPCRPASR